ncbi:MAG: tetratricopeptide repeat protein, partial [Caldilineaceae bacterium]|nr:tetratricopeptide repeat protein [Caldilineaceae bacterium]
EHLSPKTTVTLRLLHGAAGLKIIITSRARLNYSDERVVEIGGLTYPERYEAGDYLDRYPACRLFLQYAQIDHPERLPGEEQTAIARICQQLDGLPLGIRLAAAMMRIYSCQEIAANLTRTLDFAVAETSELPPRHTSLRAMFEHSWKLLNEEQRQAYARLSVFSGGFTTGAAAEVAGVSPQQLLDLVHRSLVHAITPGTDDLSMSVDRRCRLHPVLQTYAAEQLERQPELAEDTRQRHCRYYAAYTQRNDVTLGSQLLAQQMRAIEVELYNICRAWSFSVQRRELAYLEQMIWCLVHYFGLRGPFQRGEQLLDEARQALADDDAPAGTASERILAKIYTAQALLANRFAHYPAAIDAVRQTLDSDAADSETRIVAELEWGRASFHLADYANARLHLEAALHSSQTANLPHWELRALSMLGLVLLYMGEHERGVQLSHAALRASRKHDLLLDEARLLTQLGMIYFYQGRYQSAQQYYTYALHTCESVNDRAGSLATIISMGAVAQQLGDYEEARRLYHRALDLGKSIGDRNYEAVTTANLGLIAYHQGNLDQALSYLKQAHTLAISRGQRDVEAFTQTCRGHVYHAQGELGSAAQAYQQAFQLREALTQKHQLMEPLAGLALVAVDSGDVELAHRYASQMLSVIKSPWYSAAVDFFRVLWACYRALQAAHDTRAAALLAEAYQRLLARATQLDDENLKQSYLSRVAIHRQIVEEFQRQEISTS